MVVLLVTCIALFLLMDMTHWVGQPLSSPPPSTTPATKDVIMIDNAFQQLLTTTTFPDIETDLVSTNSLENAKFVSLKSVVIDSAPAETTEKDIAFTFSLAEEENHIQASGSGIDLEAKHAVTTDVDEFISTDLLDSVPRASPYLNTSLAPPDLHTTKDTSDKRSSRMPPFLVGTSVALSDDGSIMAIAGARMKQNEKDANNALLDGVVKVFSRTKRSQIGKDISLGTLDTEAMTSNGTCAISLTPDGTCIVTGWSGRIRLFQKSGDEWMEDTNVHQLFRNHVHQGAVSVATSADCHTVAVTAASSIFTARKRGGQWSMNSVYQSFATGITGNSFSRLSLSGSGLRLAMGYLLAEGENGNATGGVHVLHRNSYTSKWIHLGQPIPGIEYQAWSASQDLVSMSTDGSTVAVGGRGEVRVQPL